MLGVVPENVGWKEVKWCVDYRLKTPLLWKPVGKHENSSFESENKEGYIHGFTENYVKVKLRGIGVSEYFTWNKFDYNWYWW
jgi:threonylcarbamoyladenosine tRNA methylthiotransferase MtaB